MDDRQITLFRFLSFFMLCSLSSAWDLKTGESFPNLLLDEITTGKAAASQEEPQIEFELRPAGGKKLPMSIEGAAYYYVCGGEEGVCRFLRKPVTIKVSAWGRQGRLRFWLG